MVCRLVFVCGCMFGILKGASEPDAELDRTAALRMAEGRYRQAEILEKRAIASHREITGVRDDLVTAAYLARLGMIYRELGLPHEANAKLSQAIQIHAASPRGDPSGFAAALNNLGTVHHALRRYGAAEDALKRAIAMFEAADPAQPRRLSHALNNLAAVYEAQRKYVPASALYERALGLLDTTDPSRAATLNNLAGTRRASGDASAAETKYREAVGLWTKTIGPRHPHVAIPLANLGTLYFKLGRFSDAETASRESLSILRSAAAKTIRICRGTCPITRRY